VGVEPSHLLTYQSFAGVLVGARDRDPKGTELVKKGIHPFKTKEGAQNPVAAPKVHEMRQRLGIREETTASVGGGGGRGQGDRKGR